MHPNYFLRSLMNLLVQPLKILVENLLGYVTLSGTIVLQLKFVCDKVIKIAVPQVSMRTHSTNRETQYCWMCLSIRRVYHNYIQ